jgi:hypothetical protein
MNHHGPMYETQDVSGWSGRQLAEWLAFNPDWLDATLSSCDCEICGSVVELVRFKPIRLANGPGEPGRVV